MVQQYHLYTEQDHRTWKLLFDRQAINLQDKASTDYLLWLQELAPALQADRIASFRQLNQRLWSGTGWSIEVVPGLIPVGDFFSLLARRRFCSSTWVRKPEQIDYLEEPDMFHDIFGHVPLLMNPTYADFMQKFGEIGMKYADDPNCERQLERLYWYTVEFGLIMERGQQRIFGAGIASSFGESNHIFDDDITIHPFNIDQVLQTEFRTDIMQTEYFAIPSYASLFRSLDGVEEHLKQMTLAV